MERASGTDPHILKGTRGSQQNGTSLMVIGGACKGSRLCAGHFFHQALDLTTILANIRTQTIWMGILQHPRPYLAELDLLCDILLHHPLYLRPTAQNVDA